MFKCKKQKYRFMVVVVVVFNRKDGSLKLKIKCFIIWNEDMECTFFAFLVFLEPDHRHSLFAHYGTFSKMSHFQIGCRTWIVQFLWVSLKRNGGFFSTEKHTVWPYSVTISSSWFLYSSMTSASWQILMLTEQKSACPSFCYKNAKKKKNVDGLHLQVNILHKKMKGKQYVPLERKKKSSLTPAIWDPSTYHEYDIHKLLTLLFYSTYTILKLIPALRYASPPSPMPYVLQILNKFDLQLYKT